MPDRIGDVVDTERTANAKHEFLENDVMKVVRRQGRVSFAIAAVGLVPHHQQFDDLECSSENLKIFTGRRILDLDSAAVVDAERKTPHYRVKPRRILPTNGGRLQLNHPKS